MADVVILRYKRVNKVFSQGAVLLRTEEKERLLRTFEGLEFETMMGYLAAELQKYPGALAVLERNDRPGLPPTPFDAPLVEQLRRDPERAIQSLCYIPEAPVTERTFTATLRGGVLAVGNDTLADGFGERLFIRMRFSAKSRLVECPGCGRWQKGAEAFQCTHCGLDISIQYAEDGRWASLLTADLLLHPKPPALLFFPRGWNKGKNWVSMAEIKRLYDTFTKEKRAP